MKGNAQCVLVIDRVKKMKKTDYDLSRNLGDAPMSRGREIAIIAISGG